MIRALAAYDPERAALVDATWPVRDGLLAYEQHVRREALDDYRHEQQVFATIAPYLKKNSDVKPPQVPPILRD